GFWAAQALTIGIFASALLHPICMAATIGLYLLYPPLPPGAGLALVLLTGANLLVLVAGYTTAILITGRGLRRLGISGFFGTLATMPL
ncbi:hypothetical protein OFN94_35300, partial [Escherichia coli]|nr:hypothetical protein [Escherichia coli]